MEDQSIGIGDDVSVDGLDGVWKIVGLRPGDGLCEIQFGRDGATKQFAKMNLVSLVKKAPRPATEPGFYPGSSIMS
jgi:hypothetical protein